MGKKEVIKDEEPVSWHVVYAVPPHHIKNFHVMARGIYKWLPSGTRYKTNDYFIKGQGMNPKIIYDTMQGAQLALREHLLSEGWTIK